MGYALAEAALRRGARVLWVSGPDKPGARGLCSSYAGWSPRAKTRQAVLKLLPEATIVIKTAAVADYRPKSTASRRSNAKARCRSKTGAHHRHSGGKLARREFADHSIGSRQKPKTFWKRSRKKLMSKALDAIVVNDVSREGVGFDSVRNAVHDHRPQRSDRSARRDEVGSCSTRAGPGCPTQKSSTGRILMHFQIFDFKFKIEGTISSS